MLDLRIEGGSVVDGSGAARRVADVGVREGRITTVGRIDEPARRTIRADGLVVAPGFVDVHTHYDAQVFWDPTLSPSCFHGVTTIVGGNCGFSIAPLAPDAADYLMRMLARVEGMPLESLRQGVPWDWRSFGEYLDRLEGRLAVNAGFLVGHSALRRVVMGERAVGSEAGAEDLAAMVGLLRESIAAGGLGFSSSLGVTHHDGDGRPVPSRFASEDELVALAATLRELPGTSLELLPGAGRFSDAQKDLMTRLSLAARRPLNWNLLAPGTMGTEAEPELTDAQLSVSDYAAARGAVVVALTVPQALTVRINLVSGFLFDALPGWAEVCGMPLPERAKALRDPAVRRRLEEGAASERGGAFQNIARFESMVVGEVFDAAHERLVGRTIGEIAREQGKTPLDALLDLALSEDLRTSFVPHVPGDDPSSWAIRGRVWRDPRAVIGGSDAGAHLDMIDTFAFSTQVLGGGVRERGLLSLEDAVHELSDVPARLYGLRDRGRVAPGCFADLVLFDPESVGLGATYTRYDLPGGAGRLYADALGIDRVLVRGEEIVRGGEATGAAPGTVLRSGRDTETVEVPGGAA